MKSDFFKRHLKKIYLILLIIGLCLSLIITIIFFSEGVSIKDFICYIHTRTKTKRTIDSIYISILFLGILFCLIRIIYNLFKNKNAHNNSEQFNQDSPFLIRFIFVFIINIILFIYTLLTINKPFFKGYNKELIYIFIYLIVEIVLLLNKSYFSSNEHLIDDSEEGKLLEKNKNEVK